MAENRFFHFFPIPSFLQMPAAGLSISEDAVRYIRFSTKDMSLRLNAYGERKLAPGSIVNGKIIAPAEVSRAISECRQRSDLKFVRTTIPDEKVYLFKISLPVMPVEEVRSALEFRIEENVPMSLSETVFDYVVIGNEEKTGKLEVVVAAAAQIAVSSCADVIRQGGLEPVSLELESQAIANAVVPKGETGTVLLISLSEQKTGLFLVEHGVVQFSFTIPSEDTAAPSDSPRAEPGKVSDAKANPAYEKLYSPKYKRLPLVREEIERVINYWHDKEGSDKDIKFIVCGPDALDHELVGYLSNLLKKDLAVGSVWANAFSTDEHIPDVSEQESHLYAPAIGTALPSFLQSH